MSAVEIALGAVAAVTAWRFHVYFFPWKDCPRCGGGKRIASGEAHRDCGRCRATGRVRRYGAGKES